MPPRSLRVSSLILCIAPTKRVLVLCFGKFISPLRHTLSLWVLLLLLIYSLIGLFVCSYLPQFIFLRMRRKTPPVLSTNTGLFPLDPWGYIHFLPHPCSIQGVLFTYLSSHSPDLTENCVCEWQDLGGIRNLFLLLFSSALTSPPLLSFPGPNSILLLVFG